jgi:hypothetical protein
MAFQKAIFISLGLGSAFALAACGAKDTEPSGAGGSAGAGVGGVVGTGGAVGTGGTAPAGGAPAGGASAGGSAGAAVADCNHIDFTSYASAPAVSFTTDLLPMFGQSCVASDCHNSHDMKAGLDLGNKCDYDANAKWKCTFPATPTDPNDLTKSAPDDPTTKAAMYASLMGASKTAPALMRVKPGDPANSFLMLKLAGQQNMKGLACMNQDTSRDMTPCGGFMPLTGSMYCEGTTRPRFDAIAAWIAQGALNN